MRIGFIFSNSVRFLVGIVFIASGFVKLIDPMGLEFKIDEYFSAAVFDLPFLANYSYYLGLSLIFAEVILGFTLILGYKIKTTLFGLFCFTLFFGFLTFYSAYYNKVTDCGCFGDAIKFEPWNSFRKDIVLFVLILFLIFRRKYIHAISENSTLNQALVFLVFMICIFITRYTHVYLPFIDFRPFKIGNNIQEGMIFPETAPKSVYENLWIYKVNGEVKKFKGYDEPWNIEGAEFISRETTLIKKGYEPPIHDFVIEYNNEGFLENITDSILNLDKIYLVLSYDLNKLEEDGIFKINSWYLNEKSSKNIIMITSTSGNDLKKLKSIYNIEMPVYNLDNTVIKTIIRSNPGVMILEKGTIIDKKNWRDLEKLK